MRPDKNAQQNETHDLSHLETIEHVCGRFSLLQGRIFDLDILDLAGDQHRFELTRLALDFGDACNFFGEAALERGLIAVQLRPETQTDESKTQNQEST